MGLFSNYKLRKLNKALQSDPLRTVMATKVPLLFDAQSDPAVKAAVKKITDTMSSIPMNLYTHTKTGKKLAFSNPVFNLLNRPSLDETPTAFNMAMIRNLLISGNAYAYISRNTQGTPIMLTWLDPKKVRVNRLESGEKEYYYNSEVYSARDILHIPYPGDGYNGTLGFAPSKFATDIINLHIKLISFVSIYFENSLGNRAYIELAENYGGVKNLSETYAALAPILKKFVVEKDQAGAMMITPPGSKIGQINQPSNAEAELSSLITMCERMIYHCYGIPPECINSTMQKYASLEANQGNFLQSCIMPLGKHICECYEMALIPPGSGPLFIQYEYKNLLTTDTKSTISCLKEEMQSGMLSINEARKKLGEQDIGSAGDYYWIPGNLIPVTEDNIAAYFAKSKAALMEDHNQSGDDKE